MWLARQTFYGFGQDLFNCSYFAAGNRRDNIASEDYGVRQLDPLVMGSVVMLLGAVALVACALPARRAMLVDPVVVLGE